MSLRTRVGNAFESAFEHASGVQELSVLRETLERAQRHLDEPMRVAIVGHIKAGKSTMLNALLGEDVAPTGIEELTYNVNWLRYGQRPRVFVHYKDRRPPEERHVNELEALTSRDQMAPGVLASIRYVERHSPNEILRSFDLVDTPGLKSFFSTDSLNALHEIGLDVEAVESLTREESGLADAILCLFTRSLALAEQSVVADFQGPLLAHATPINAIGVLTKVDAYWEPSEPGRDPLAVGREVARGIAAEPGAERVFYAVVPVCGLLAFGAQTLTEDELATLRKLAELPEPLLIKRLAYAERFATREYDDVPVAARERAALLDRLGQYGLWLAARLIREGLTDGLPLREELWRRSGAAGLREMIVSHFGHRALLIKTQASLRKALHESFQARQRLQGGAAAAASAAGGALEALELGEPAFEELGLLRRYYQERDTLGLRDGEGEELQRVTGERGSAIGPRLGLDERAAPAELVAAAEDRRAYWQARHDGFGADPQTLATARVMMGAYQRILYHAREASRHLELDP